MAADRMAPPFIITLVIEGVGTLTRSQLQESVDTVVQKHPWLCAKLIGALATCRWTNGGNPPKVVEFSDPNWDGEGATTVLPWDSNLSPTQGDTLSIWLVHSALTRIIFRAPHAFMDGRALGAFANAIGDALSGSHTTVLKPALVTDIQAASEIGSIHTQKESTSRHPFRDPPTQAAGTLWRRRQVPLPPSDILASVALALATFSTDPAPFVVEIPVDTRPALGLPNVVGNLTGLLRLPILNENPAKISTRISDAIAQNDHLQPTFAAHALRFFPISILSRVGSATHRRQIKTGQYLFGATVSNLGRADLSKFICPTFEPSTCYWIPPHSPSNPLLVILCGVGSHLEITAGAPCALGDNGRLDALLDHIVNGLTPTAVS
jgi:hypothetical protein